jgi:hypothetical protein
MGQYIAQNTEYRAISLFNFSSQVAADLMLVSGQDESTVSLQWENFGLSEHNVTTYKAAIWFKGLSPAGYLKGLCCFFRVVSVVL